MFFINGVMHRITVIYKYLMKNNFEYFDFRFVQQNQAFNGVKFLINTGMLKIKERIFD